MMGSVRRIARLTLAVVFFSCISSISTSNDFSNGYDEHLDQVMSNYQSPNVRNTRAVPVDAQYDTHSDENIAPCENCDQPISGQQHQDAHSKRHHTHPRRQGDATSKDESQPWGKTETRSASDEADTTSIAQRHHDTMISHVPEELDETSEKSPALTTMEKLGRISKARKVRKEKSDIHGSRQASKPGNLLRALEKAENKFEKKNTKITSKLTALRENTAGILNQLNSKILQQSVEKYPADMSHGSTTKEKSRVDPPQIQGITWNIVKKVEGDLRSGQHEDSSVSFNQDLNDFGGSGLTRADKGEFKSGDMNTWQNDESPVNSDGFISSGVVETSRSKHKHRQRKGRNKKRRKKQRTGKSRKGSKHMNSGSETEADLMKDSHSPDAMPFGDEPGSAGHGDYFAGNRLVRPAAADRLEQQISPSLNTNYRQLMEHLNGILQNFSEAMETVDSLYMEVFNGTRYDMMMGAREIFEGIHEANDYVYDGVMSSTHFTRQLMLKAHRNRDNRLSGSSLDQPAEVTATMVEQRDFESQLQRTYEEKRKAEEEIEEAQEMKMKCKQGEARVQQVRERFYTNHDLLSLKDVIDYLNITIIRMNRGMEESPGLVQLRREKFYLDYLKGDIEVASSVLKNSSDAVHEGMMEMRENHAVYSRWEREQMNDLHNGRNGHGFQADARNSLSPQQYQDLQNLVAQAKKHAYYLDTRLNRLQSILGSSTAAAKAALSSPGTRDTSLSHLQPMIHVLKMLTKDLISSLDLLRRLIGSKVKITHPRACKSALEGSGWDDDYYSYDDEDDLCEDEGSGAADRESDKVFVTDDEDFSFTGEPLDNTVSPLHPMKQLGLDLANFTLKLLQDSQRIYDSVRSLERFLASLQQRWSGMESRFYENERFADTQRNFILVLEDSARDFQEIRNRIRQITYRVAEVERYNLDNVVERANRAIERAKKQAETDKKPRPIMPVPQVKTTTTTVTVPQVKTTTTTVTVPQVKTTIQTFPEEEIIEEKEEHTESKKEEPEEEKKEDVSEKETDKEEIDDFDYSGLFRQGREIMSNRDDIRLLQAMAIESCGKIGSHFTHIRGNMSTLRQKVEKAREMLATLQMSISKSGSGHIPVLIPQTQGNTAGSLATSITACFKPRTLDGTLLTVMGNNSASYSVTMSDGEVTVTAYDESNDDLDEVTLDQAVVADQWYNLEIQRIGDSINVTILRQDGEVELKSKQVSNLRLTQPQPLTAYVGGVPTSLGFGSGPWEGCVGELSVNGRALTLFQMDSEGNEPSLCTDHCAVAEEKLAMVFSGDGFAHFHLPEREIINMITLRFKTRQNTASLLSVTNRSWRYHLNVAMVNGALKVESSSSAEDVVLLSLNSSLNDGESHLLKIVYRGRAYPELDGKREAFSVERARPQILTDIQDGVLIGAFVSRSRQYVSSQYRPFTGCVGDLVINDNKLSLPEADEVYNTYQGHCKASSLNIWHSCWQWSETSQPLSFGPVENSNRISVLVSRGSLGPLIHYAKEDKYDIEVSMTEDGIDVSSDDSEGVMIRPETDNHWFTLVTIIDDGDDVYVKAWDQSIEISYGGFWGFASVDLTEPHIVAIGESKDADDRMFIGSLAQFAIEGRFYDLSQHSASHSLSSCERPVEDIRPKPGSSDGEEPEPFSCA